MEDEKNMKEGNKELDRYERIVDRAHKEIEGVRSVYKMVATILGTIITVGIACVTFLTYNTIKDMRSDLNQQADQLASEVRARIEKEFEQPAIKATVQEAATGQSAILMKEYITPEVNNFKTKVDNQLEKLNSLVTTIKELEAESQEYKQGIQTVLDNLQHSLEQSQNQLSTTKSDIVEMQKYIAIIQFYQITGANQLPNPYGKEMLDALNKLVAITIPNPVERSKFIAELQSLQEPKK